MKHVITYRLEKILSHLFFFFFLAQIFSPSFGDKTIYIELIIAILNPYFLLWISKYSINYKHIVLFGAVMFIGTMGHPLTSVKLLVILIEVMYLFYAVERNLFILKFYLMLSILMATFQFAFLFIDVEIARQLGPANMAELVWGSHATATFTNFYTIFWIPRVSGLSRESGFFASLIVAVITFYYIKSKREKIKMSITEKIFFSIGYVLSFSKMSIILLCIFFIEKSKNLICLIPYWMGIVLFILFMIVFWRFNIDFLLDDKNITFLHRFSAYTCLLDIELRQLVFGIDKTAEVGNFISKTVAIDFEQFAGFGGFILHNGLLVTIVWLFALHFYGVTTVGVVLLLLLTINVSLDTNQNFVVFAYFLIFKYYSKLCIFNK